MKKNLLALPQHYFYSKKKEKTTSLTKNILSCREYVIWNIVMASIYFVSFMLGRFTPFIKGRTELSAIILVVVVTLWFAAGISLTLHNRRTFSSIIGNIFPPFLAYSLLTDSIPFRQFWFLIISICITLAFVFSLQKILGSKKSGTSRKLSQLIRHCFITTRNTTASVLLVILTVCNIWTISMNLFAANDTPPHAAERCSIEDYADELEVFQDDVLSTATKTRIVKGLQAAANIESTNQGLSFTPIVKTAKLKKATLACYNHKTHTIYFNIDNFYDSTNTALLNAVLHECYHAQQHSLIEAYDSLAEEKKSLSKFKYLENYKKELKNYVDCDEDFNSYKSQQIEIDARNYARKAILQYENFLKKRRIKNE